jgi:hypothetical protein
MRKTVIVGVCFESACARGFTGYLSLGAATQVNPAVKQQQFTFHGASACVEPNDSFGLIFS